MYIQYICNILPILSICWRVVSTYVNTRSAVLYLRAAGRCCCGPPSARKCHIGRASVRAGNRIRWKNDEIFLFYCYTRVSEYRIDRYTRTLFERREWSSRSAARRRFSSAVTSPYWPWYWELQIAITGLSSCKGTVEKFNYAM